MRGVSLWLVLSGCGPETGGQGGDTQVGGGGAGGALPEPCGAIALGSTDPRFAELTSEIEAWQAAEGISGVAWGVREAGAPPQLGVLGTRETGTCSPLTTSTLFRTYFPSQRAAILSGLVLVERGDLELDASLEEAVALSASPFAGPYASEPRVRHALTESVGMTDGFLQAGSGLLLGTACDEGGSLEEYWAARPPTTLRFHPGDALSNSNLDFLLLGRMVQRAAGTATFAAAVRALLLEPHGIQASYDPEADAVEDRARALASEERCDAKAPVDGLHLSIEGLLRLHTAMLDGQIVTDATRLAALSGRPLWSPSGPAEWPIDGLMLDSGTELLLEASYSEGVGSCVAAVPSSGFVAVAHFFQANVTDKTQHVLPCARALERFTSVTLEPFDHRSADLDPYVGLYVEPLSGAEVVVTMVNETLTANGQYGQIALLPTTALAWAVETDLPDSFDQDLFLFHRFIRDDGGAVIGVLVQAPNGTEDMHYRAGPSPP